MNLLKAFRIAPSLAVLVCTCFWVCLASTSSVQAQDVDSNLDSPTIRFEPNPSAQSLEQDRIVVIGTAPVSGVYYPAGGSICRLLQKGIQRHGLRCLVESTSGSEENLNGVMQDRLDVGIVQSDWHYFAVKGLASFRGSGDNDRLRSLFALHQDDIVFVVRPNSGITDLSDLEGRRLNFGPEGSGQRAITEILLGTANLGRGDLAGATDYETSGQAVALCQGEIDAFFLPVATPSYAIAEIVNLCGGQIVPIKGNSIDELIKSNPFFVRSKIPGNTYGNISKAVSTFGLRATVVTTSDLPDDVAYEIVASVFDNFEAFREQHIAFRNLDRSQMRASGLSAPLHPGAKRYFDEKGIN